MKKSFFLVIISLISVVAVAQIQFGAKAGLNLATILTSPSTPGTSTRAGLNAVGLAYFPFFNNFALQPEVQYSGEGAKISNSGMSTTTLNSSYINVPVFFKYKIP